MCHTGLSAWGYPRILLRGLSLAERILKMAYNVFSSQTGNVFENECAYRVRNVSKNTAGSYFESTVGTERDQFDGTDIVYGWDRQIMNKVIRNHIPVDFTYNFEGKNRMKVLPATYTLPCGMKIKFGIRYGNGHSNFSEPVLVIGFMADSYWINSMMEDIMDDFQAAWPEIFRIGGGKYRQLVPIKAC